MSNNENQEIIESIQESLEDIKVKVTAYCDFLELMSKKNQKLLIKLRDLLNN